MILNLVICVAPDFGCERANANWAITGPNTDDSHAINFLSIGAVIRLQFTAVDSGPFIAEERHKFAT